MNPRQLALSLLGLAITLGSMPNSPAAAAGPSVRPAVPAVAARTASVDVDGDGRKDLVVLNQPDATHAVVTVTTARGLAAQREVSISDYPYEIEDAWYATAKLDGSKGAEIILNTFSGDGAGFTVLTWRRGALIIEEAAKSPGANMSWYLLGAGFNGSGYHFFTSAGKRYVDAGDWQCTSDHGRVCSVRAYRSVWRSGSWHKVKAYTSKRLTWGQIHKFTDFTGVKLAR